MSVIALLWHKITAWLKAEKSKHENVLDCIEIRYSIRTINILVLQFPKSGAILVFLPGYAEIQSLFDQLKASHVTGGKNKARWVVGFCSCTFWFIM